MVALYGLLVIVANADVVTALPRTIRAWKSKSLRRKNHSYRKGKTD
jgi:hypothetical protein